MRNFTKLIMVVIVMLLSTSMVWSQAIPQKVVVGYDQSLYDSPRQGGEDIGSANVINSLPYNDNGTTSGYTKDYTASCYFNDLSPDVVYSYTPGVDIAINISLCGSAYDCGLFVYENSAANEIACNDDACGLQSQLNNIYLTAGNTYYIVIGGFSGASGNYVIDVNSVPVPDQTSGPTPADQTIDVAVGSTLLSWTNGANTDEIQVLFGTEYPPIDVLVDWTSPISSTLATVDYNQQYFWQVNARNGSGTTYGDIWGFTTEIMPPSNVLATQDENFDVRVEWTSSVVMPPAARALVGYNIFEAGIQIATEVPGDSYVVTNPTYDMTVGTCYQVQAVFDEGVSAWSNCTAGSTIFVNGEGSVSGTVTDAMSMATLSGATITLAGVDPQMGTWDYEFTTDLNGDYSGAVAAGTYEFTVTLDQYEDGTASGVVVVNGVNTVTDFALDPWGPPACADTPYPADTEQEIGFSGLTLTWNLDEIRTDEYKILFDTEYPPMDVLVDWSPAAESFALPADLDPNMQYFWQVQVRNSWGDVTDCDIWGFTTTINVPGNLTATVMDVNDVLLEWTSSEQPNREFIEYVVYRDAVEIATTTDTEYFDEDVAYNPMTCYSYTVEAVFDEGTSELSDPAEACITGYGMVDGYVMSLLTNDPIEGATVALDGIGELGDPFTYTFTTDAMGYYSGDVMVGNYDYMASAVDYLPGYANDDVAFDMTTTVDFYLDEEPYALDYVIATELNDDEVHLEWGFDMAMYSPETMPFETTGMSDEEITSRMRGYLLQKGFLNYDAYVYNSGAAQEGGSREIESYDVYRGLWDGVWMGEFTYLGNTTQTQFIDYDWSMQTTGVYKWAVVIKYTNNDSDPTYSNLLDKDMETVVNIEVTLNSAESAEGALVMLENTSEPYLGLSYSAFMDAAGMATIDPFRKGDYDITVSKNGYGTVYDAQLIYDETTLTYLLIETINTPINLYVNPNGFATWIGDYYPLVSFLDEDFDAGWPAGWTQTSSDPAWPWSAVDYYEDWQANQYTLDGTPFMMIDGSSNTWNIAELYSPVMNTSGMETVVFEMDHYLNKFMNTAALIEVYDGSQWVLIKQWGQFNPSEGAWGDPVHLMFDVTQYANENFQVKFTYANFWFEYYWAIDNVKVTNGGVDVTRSLTNYKVWLDDVLSGETTEEMWDYEANETLVEGQTYLAEVATLFTTGLSDRASYMFTYHSCDYFDGPTAVTADVVPYRLDVLVSWTEVASNVPGDDVVGVNIFRDGELIATVAAGTNFYTDANVGAGDYEYCITNVYESGAQSCQVCDMVTVDAGATVNGYVTDFATGDPIEGAEVKLVAWNSDFDFYTDATGYYEGEVPSGGYSYEVSAAGYATEVRTGFWYGNNITYSEDFELKEFPYPVGTVIATEINDNSVLVNWSGQGGGGGDDVYLDFEDGMPAEFLTDSDRWSVADGNLVMDGDGLTTYASGYYDQMFSDFVFEFDINRTGDAGTLGNTMGCFVRADGFAGTGTQNGYAYSITQGGSWWYAKYVNGALTDWTGWLTSTAINTGLDQSNIVSIEASGTTLMYFINGTLIHTVTDADYAEGYCNVMVYDGAPGAEVLFDYYSITPAATAMNYAVSEETPRQAKGSIDNCISGIENAPVEARGVTILPAPTEEALRALVGYNVYVGPCGGEAEDMTFIGFTLDQTYTDNTWGVAEPGIYSWAVEAVYDFNASEFAYSNCLDKDMETTVTVEVTTNSGDSPEGTDVVFTNVSEMADPAIVFETELDASGIYTWTDFRKGTYDIYVHLNGFGDITMSDVYIWDEAYFEWMLEELLAPPSNLYVTPLGYATWTPGGIVPFEPVMETFDEGIPETWTVVDGGSSADTWMWVTDDAGSTLDGTPFMFADSDGAGSGTLMQEELISPVIENTQNADMLFVQFDQYFNQGWDAAAYADVDVWDGDEWVNVLHQAGADAGNWGAPDHQMIDVTEFANPEFQVRFFYSATWDWWWAVDNVAVTEGDAKYADRMLEYYKVWHESTFITDRDTSFYQYGDNGEVLVPYTTYHAEVATVFSTGISPKSEYYWTYIPCEDFPGPAQFNAENIEDTKDVLLTWSDIIPMELVFVTQNPGAPANGYFQSYDMGYGVVYDLSAYPDALANSIEFHHAAWGVAGPHDYNIHIIDWDTETTLAVLGPFITTGDDQWEMDIDLGDVDLMGAENVAFLMEPLSNSPTDAYPDLSSDNGSDPQGSVFGPLDDIGSIGSSTIGNFLMNIYIMTAYGEVKVSSTALDIPAGPAATPRVGQGHPVIEAIITNQTAERGGDDDPLVGANLYRDGEMIAFVELPDTSYVDEDLAPGYYDYCIAYLYESGAHSCVDGMCIEDVLVPEDCDAPNTLTAELDEENYYLVHLLWDQGTGIAEWLYYDDGTNVDGIGGPAIFHWAIKFDPDQLTAYDGTSVTKISLYCRTAPVNTLQIFEGTGAETLIHEQDLVGLTVEAWNEVELDSPVLIDVSKELWITVYTEDGANYPAGCGATTNEPNGDLISQDGGVTWDHLSDFSLPYTWNLRCYVEDAKGVQAPLAIVNDKVYNTTTETLSASGVVNTSEGAVWTIADNSSREWLGYNVYRNGELLLEEYPDNFYDDEDVEAGTVYCYEVTSVYSICGESDPTNEACVGNVGVPELDATEANLYPNPARDQITIEAVDMTRLHIVNYVGQVVYSQEFDNVNSKQLDTQNYQSGVYVARIYTENGIVTKRFVINR